MPARGIELPSPVCTAPTGTRRICGAPGAATAPPPAAAFNAAADLDAAAADADAAAVLGVDVGLGVAEALALGGTTGVAAQVGRMIVS